MLTDCDEIVNGGALTTAKGLLVIPACAHCRNNVSTATQTHARTTCRRNITTPMVYGCPKSISGKRAGSSRRHIRRSVYHRPKAFQRIEVGEIQSLKPLPILPALPI